MLNNSAWVQFWITAGGVATVLIAWIYREKIAKLGKRPKTREDIIFDGYERLIEKQQEDSDRKDVLIDKLEGMITDLHTQLDKAEDVILSLRENLLQEKKDNREIKEELFKLRKQSLAEPEVATE